MKWYIRGPMILVCWAAQAVTYVAAVAAIILFDLRILHD